MFQTEVIRPQQWLIGTFSRGVYGRPDLGLTNPSLAQVDGKRALLTSRPFGSSCKVPLPETGRSDRSARPFVVAQRLLTSEQVSDDGVFVPQWVLCASRRRAAVSILQKVYRALSYADSVKIAADIVRPCGQ